MEDEQLKNSLHADNYETQFPPIHQQQLNQPPQPPLPQQQQNQPPQPQYPHQQKNQPPHPHCYQPHSHPAGNPRPHVSHNNVQIPVQVTQPPNLSSPHQQHQSTNPPNCQDHHGFSKSDLTFLAQIIKETIKEDLSKEVASLKQNLELQIQLAKTQLANTLSQAQMHPDVFNAHPSAPQH